ncbi:MAG TPA: hypothetical protein VMF87_19590 [Streptosporangiaceae bacterium]|nr:hypothetical protein [Streptosporangiaceae bacterium]
MQTIVIIDPCGCLWRGNPRDGYDLTTCVVHWLCDMLEAGEQPPLRGGRRNELGPAGRAPDLGCR